MSATVPNPKRPGRGPVFVEVVSVVALFVALAVLGIVFFRLLDEVGQETQGILREMREEIAASDRQNIRIHQASLCVLQGREDCRAKFLRPGDLRPQPPPDNPPASPSPGGDAGGNGNGDGGDGDGGSPSPSPQPTPPPPTPEPSPSPTVGCLPIIGCI